jgi:hypothetical protein
VDLAAGGLFAVDRTSRAVFRVDTTTGAQTLVSQAAHLLAPQGIERRGIELVVADPAGLVTVARTGAQRLASPPLVGNTSLQVVFGGAALDAYVLEASGITKVVWNWSGGIGAKTAFLAVPTPEPIPLLSGLRGDSLALEPSGNLLTTGVSLYGDGVYRVTPAAAVSIVGGGFQHVTWLDLAIESDQKILAVGEDLDVGTGVYRIDPITGAITVLNTSFAWQTPTGVTVAPDGEIYVADAGVCAGGACSGGKIVNVDPLTGAATLLSSGGLIAGELDVVALPEPGGLPTWLAAIATLKVLERRRASRRAR